ncbi:hypothetical protein M758_1G318100 [Ceratodon purpureus]|nr:hypothetical protein M758_1G318100 [Ceratodon purpureus]
MLSSPLLCSISCPSTALLPIPSNKTLPSTNPPTHMVVHHPNPSKQNAQIPFKLTKQCSFPGPPIEEVAPTHTQCCHKATTSTGLTYATKKLAHILSLSLSPPECFHIPTLPTSRHQPN